MPGASWRGPAWDGSPRLVRYAACMVRAHPMPSILTAREGCASTTNVCKHAKDKSHTASASHLGNATCTTASPAEILRETAGCSAGAGGARCAMQTWQQLPVHPASMPVQLAQGRTGWRNKGPAVQRPPVWSGGPPPRDCNRYTPFETRSRSGGTALGTCQLDFAES